MVSKTVQVYVLDKFMMDISTSSDHAPITYKYLSRIGTHVGYDVGYREEVLRDFLRRLDVPSSWISEFLGARDPESHGNPFNRIFKKITVEMVPYER